MFLNSKKQFRTLDLNLILDDLAGLKISKIKLTMFILKSFPIFKLLDKISYFKIKMKLYGNYLEEKNTTKIDMIKINVILVQRKMFHLMYLNLLLTIYHLSQQCCPVSLKIIKMLLHLVNNVFYIFD